MHGASVAKPRSAGRLSHGRESSAAATTSMPRWVSVAGASKMPGVHSRGDSLQSPATTLSTSRAHESRAKAVRSLSICIQSCAHDMAPVLAAGLAGRFDWAAAAASGLKGLSSAAGAEATSFASDESASNHASRSATENASISSSRLGVLTRRRFSPERTMPEWARVT